MAKFPLGICLMFMITTSTIYEVQGHFLLDHYMKKIPKISSEFEPFAFKGILSFIDHLEGLCPLKVEYKEFFTKLKDFMAFINSASGSSAEFHTQLKTKSEELFKAITKMGGTAGASAHTTKLIESLMSMGKTLAEYKRSGSQTLTSEQRTELVTSMSRWAQTIGQFVKSVTETNGGANIDLKSLGCGGATGISTSMETGSTASGSTNMETGSTGGSGSPSGDTGSPASGGSESGSPSNETPAEGGSGSPSGSPSDSSSGAGSTGSETSTEAETTAGSGSGAGAGETPGAAGPSGSPTGSPTESEESSKDESSKDESSKDESSKDESSKDESSKDKSSKGEKDESSKDESSKDESSKDESSKDESSKDESSKDKSSKDDKDESSKDESSKDESSKDESSKDESSKGESSAESGESSKEASGASSTETQSETGAESGSTDGGASAGGPSGEPPGDAGAGAPSGSTSDMSAGGASASGGASGTSTQTSAEGESSMNSGGSSYADTTGGSAAEGSASSPSGSASGSSETSSITGSENSSYQAGGSSAGGPSGSTTAGSAAGESTTEESSEGGSGASENQSVKGKKGTANYEERLGLYRLPSWSSHHSSIRLISKRTFPQRLAVRMSASTLPMNLHRTKKVWIWTECKEVMTTAVERGWNTFVFSSDNLQLSDDWSSVALVDTLFIDERQVTDGTGKVVAAVFEVSTPEELQMLKIENEQTENIVLGLLDWKSIPAENLVAALQGSEKTVFAISSTPSEAKLYLEALEHGLGGIILKTEDVKAVLDLKDYFDKRSEESDTLSLTEATITRIEMVGMGDRVCVDLCSLMRPGEGLLVGSFARGLFLVHSECLESNYIASRPFRVNAGPVHAYVAVPGGKTCYLSELRTGREVIVVDLKGKQRTAVVGRVKIEKRPLILVEAKLSGEEDETSYSIILQNAETVALVTPHQVKSSGNTAVPVTSLKLGDQVLIRLQGGARHTGIEIQEFIVEN
ncbi:unnamed protein product [Brassica napus]|uniref:(rape) hypothetical protein n=1 Tax=Brassica napus TaxID=3708 RepID=A0A816MQP2_BRANA|nr:unnamed protein product [Brassica napus]